jgi:hypothetical protein
MVRYEKFSYLFRRQERTDSRTLQMFSGFHVNLAAYNSPHINSKTHEAALFLDILSFRLSFFFFVAVVEL